MLLQRIPESRFPLMVRVVWLTLIFSPVTLACEKSDSTPEVQSIVFGSDGGTGKQTAYTLYASGQIKTGQGNATTVIKLIEPADATMYFNSGKGLLNYNYNSPGNLSEYLTIRTTDTQHHITWDAGSVEVDARAKSLYDSLVNELNK